MLMSDFLHWRTDPLLLDPIPIAKNDWLTANKLIEQKKQSMIYLEPEILNLYTIMVRKHDFVSGERLLQRLPYVSLPSKLALSLREQSLSLAERCHYYFQDTAIHYSIKKWQQKIIDYLENQKRLPFPLFRLCDHYQVFLSQEFVPFQSARGEQFHLPTKLSIDLAYFLGVVIGDGHLNLHNVVLVDFSEKQMKYLQILSQELFGIKGPVTGEKKVWLLHLNNKWLVRLANFLSDQPITGKKYHALREPKIFQKKEQLRWAFWSGLLDADGSYKKQISFSSASKSFIDSFSKVLQKYKIHYTIRTLKSKYGTSFELRIKTISKSIIEKYLQPRHPIKKKELLAYLSQKQYKPRTKQTENLKISDFNAESLTQIGNVVYFNFELLQQLSVLNSHHYLTELRKTYDWTQEELADLLNISKSQLASYEYRSNFPIKYLLQILHLLPNSPTSLMVFLNGEQLYYYRSRKTIARLDLQPNKKLLSIMRNFEIRQKYLAINYSGEDLNEFYSKIGDYFAVPHPTTNQFNNSVILLYAKTFFQTFSQNP